MQDICPLQNLPLCFLVQHSLLPQPALEADASTGFNQCLQDALNGQDNGVDTPYQEAGFKDSLATYSSTPTCQQG